MQQQRVPQFTNLDWRMRPVDVSALGRPEYVPAHNARLWSAPPSNFPALNALVQREANALGIGPVWVAVMDTHESARYYDTPRGRVIGLGIDFLNRARFEDVRTVVGHELGHHMRQVRYSHNDTQDFRHREEYAADLFSACQQGSVDNVIRSLRTAFSHPVSSYSHPSTSERIAHLEEHRDEVRSPLLDGLNNVCSQVARPGASRR